MADLGASAGSPARGLSDCLDGDAAAVTDDQCGFGRPATLCTARSYELYLPFNTLATTTVTAAGDTYTSGGYQLELGQDSDSNSTLNDHAVRISETVCHGVDGNDGADGTDGASALVDLSVEDAGANCEFGGT
ncbi:MAG: hypothetical protein ACI9MR_001603 [Myxococcota bacterium]|jgi:hypothetical protein